MSLAVDRRFWVGDNEKEVLRNPKAGTGEKIQSQGKVTILGKPPTNSWGKDRWTQVTGREEQS